MDCSNAREAISALLDGEPFPADPQTVAGHLDDCPDCRLWKERAHTVTRHVRLAPAEAAPTAGLELLQAIAATLPIRVRARRHPAAARVGLVLVALAQLAFAVPALILGTDREAPLHVAHEMGSFDMALAIGFLIVALQPARARGMHLLVGAAASLLIVTAVIDVVAGRTSVGDEAPHLLVVAGWLLMFTLVDWAPIGSGAERIRGRESLRAFEREPIRGEYSTGATARARRIAA